MKIYIFKIAKRIRIERIRQGIPLSALCRGICSESMLHRIEMEKQEAEWFVLDCLWQRLGQSFEDCSVILPFKEYDLWRKRQDMIHTVDSGQFKLAYERIQAYHDVIRGRNKLHAQLLGYYLLSLREKQEVAWDELLEANRELLAITRCPSLIEVGGHYYGQTELMLYLQSGRLFEKAGRIREAEQCFQRVAQYLNCHNYDIRLQKRLLGEHPKYQECKAEEFGTVLRSRRICMGIPQEQLAEGICSTVTLSRLERGKNAPRRDIREKLLERIGFLIEEEFDS